jgi:tetratricopeptide (TPR) repeat protein
VGLLLIRADAAFALGDYALAESRVNDAARERPGFNIWTRRAQLATVFGRDAEAERAWAQALATCPTSDAESRAWTLLMRGIAELKQGQLVEARVWFERARATTASNALALEHLAETYEIAGDDATARPLLEAAIALTRDPALLMRLADMDARGNDAAAAAALRDEALAQAQALVDAGHIGHLRALATILMDLNRDLPRALALAQKDLEIRRDIGAYATLARAQRLTGDAAAALESIETGLAHGTRDAELWLEKAAILRALGRETDAADAEKTARSINPLAAS